MDGEDALKFLELDRLIRSLDLEQVVRDKQAKLTPMEQLVRDIERGKVVSRKRKRPKMHYKVRRRKKREYYATKEKPKRQRAKAALLASGASGWWTFLTHQWYQTKVPVVMKKEEWEEVVWPLVDGKVFTIKRYDTKRGIELTNIVVVDSSNGSVLYDGKEYELRRLGYIL